jgi:hypothetical protein
MNGKTIKKIRKEINSSFNEREKEIAGQIFNYFNSLSFFGRLKIAVKILKKKL